MDAGSYEIHGAVLSPQSVQPVTRGAAGKKNVEPIEFNLTEHADTSTNKRNRNHGLRPTLWEDFQYRADNFKFWLSTRCCTCLSFVPSLALVLISAVLIMLLVATIPLAFALTYSSPQVGNIDNKASENDGLSSDNFTFFVDREHSSWPELKEVLKYQDWEEHTPLLTTEFLPKNITSCTVYGFSCTSQPHIVISKNRRCDGYPDCEDKSDEIDCHECQTTLSCPASTVNKNSRRKICLVGQHLCDANKHCPGAEDETVYCHRNVCAKDEYRCKDSAMCIPNLAVCDGENHCPLGDDEHNCSKCNGESKMCGDLHNGICLAKRLLCDGFVDCHFDGSDEKDCNCASCSSKFSALCNGTKKMCISKSSVCDGNLDCPDGEDEHGCPGVCLRAKDLSSLNNNRVNLENVDKIYLIKVNTTNHLRSVQCSDGHLHEWEQACGGLLVGCRFDCEACNHAIAFRCHSLRSLKKNNSSGNETNDTSKVNEAKTVISEKRFPECIHRSLVCDGKLDCSDGSDELECSCNAAGMNECNQHFKAKVAMRRCYPDAQKCDGYSDCIGGEDERKCTNCSNGAFLCRTEGRCVPSVARCNGVPDCLDESDEMNCTCEECSQHSEQMYMCEAANRCYPMNKVCSPYSLCKNATRMDKMFCAIRGHEYF